MKSTRSRNYSKNLLLQLLKFLLHITLMTFEQVFHQILATILSSRHATGANLQVNTINSYRYCYVCLYVLEGEQCMYVCMSVRIGFWKWMRQCLARVFRGVFGVNSRSFRKTTTSPECGHRFCYKRTCACGVSDTFRLCTLFPKQDCTLI